MICFLWCLLFLVSFAHLNEPLGLIHRKALIQEGVDEQIAVLLHLQGPPPKNRIIEAKLQQYKTDEYVPYVFLALLLSASIGGLSHHHLYASDIERLGN